MSVRPPRPRLLIASALLVALVLLLFHAPSHATVQQYLPSSLSRPRPIERPSPLVGSDPLEADLTWDEVGADKGSWKGFGIPWLGGSSGNKGRKKLLITGGAGQLGRALIPALSETHDIDILDIVPRPATLPAEVTYHRGSVLPSSSALPSLLNRKSYDGIIHLASISLDDWCAAKLEECEDVNIRGTKRLMELLKAKAKTPWIVLGSGMTDETTLGKIRVQIEAIALDAVESSRALIDSDEARPGLRATILRFPQIYGYDYLNAIQSTFIPSIVSAALTSLTIQYDQSAVPFDLLHVDDAVAGVKAAIKRLEEGQVGLYTADFDSGKRYTQAEVVDLVRQKTGTMSPVRAIGHGEAARPLEPEGVPTNDLGWTARVSLDQGLDRLITEINQATHDYSTAYLAQQCSATTLHPADERNRHLDRLHGCTVTLGFEHNDMLHHLKCEDGKHCRADGDKVAGYNWNATVWKIYDVDKKTGSGKWSGGGKSGSSGKGETRKTRVMFSEEQGMGWLGINAYDVNKEGKVGLELFDEESDEDESGMVVFDVEVAEGSSFLRMTVPDTTRQIRSMANVSDETTWFSLEPEVQPHFDMRMTVLCCDSEGDWPLLLDDHESADIRFGSTGQIPFNASRRMHLCHRAEQAVRHSSAPIRSTDPPARLSQLPHDWAIKDLPACWNDCNSPTICVQTGSCRCVISDGCRPRRENPLQLLGKVAAAASAASNSPLGMLKGYDPILATTVATLDFRDVLRPEARAAIDAHPEFIKVHVADGYSGQDKIESANCHKLQETHCFSADSIMYKALRYISVPADEAELVVLPVYQHCTGADFLLHDVMHYVTQTISGVRDHNKTVGVVMTHDWGICIAFAWEIWSARNNHALYPDSILNNVLVFSVMGDYDSPCYRPHQDIVVPARTCRSYELQDAFPNVEAIRPARERKHLMTWAGTYWGTGKNTRLRLTCTRGGAGKRELIKGQGPQDNFNAWHYMDDLGNARFCPQPRGIAGWSPRTNDAIFAGCIPVLIAEGSHYPYATTIDWSKISVRIHPTELDRIEQILEAIPLTRVEELQANLVVVREAFLYPGDESAEQELARKGPMWFSLHEAGMRMRTRYPSLPVVNSNGASMAAPLAAVRTASPASEMSTGSEGVEAGALEPAAAEAEAAKAQTGNEARAGQVSA